MHYFIDGYNLLFQSAFLDQKRSLEEARTALIHELDRHAEFLHLHITLVFDAAFQDDECKRGHFKMLELIYTARGHTADDYLVTYADNLHAKERITVVTSDKRLARRLKKPNVDVEGVLDFLHRIRKKSSKKNTSKTVLRASPTKTVKGERPLPKQIDLESIFQQELSKKQPPSLKELPPLTDIDAWEAIFLSKFKKSKN